ncbi:hypothetical protein [Caulobacter segnis]|uniref:Ribbon-helix-helix protein CopG domain-containing protein n=1 Tax=Caulobacter segnis TaxID=88688 RepID=A0A2W5VM96_9CAUL|nr:hypothetical protein [Caulobacter segnis]PZR36495.1 MAG: hypothetical protein DI526_03400 [Caulobacter segnis]
MVAMTVQPQLRKKPGPPATGKGTPVQVRLQPNILADVDAWIDQQPDPKPSRPEAVRRLATEGLISWGVRDPAKNA